jgi:hypothetical protein
MKKIVAIVIGLVGAVAQAYPTAGDKAQYQTVAFYNTASGNDPSNTVLTVTGMTTVNVLQVPSSTSSSTGVQVFETTTIPMLYAFPYYNGVHNDEMYPMGTNDIPYMDAATILKNCGKNPQGDDLQTITVPAGTFQTCYENFGAGFRVWVGNVPTGVVQFEIRQGWGTILMQLM